MNRDEGTYNQAYKLSIILCFQGIGGPRFPIQGWDVTILKQLCKQRTAILVDQEARKAIWMDKIG